MSAGVSRDFYLSIPSSYDHTTPTALYVGFHGGNYDGIRMRDYLGLENVSPKGELFVYPDALLREWEDDWQAVGWQNGPATDWMGGTEDINFVNDMLDYLEKRLCIDKEKVFIIGHSWGAEFTNALACYGNDRFRGFVSAAANYPYYLPLEDGPPCDGPVDAWIMHGKADAHFPKEMGIQLRDFWVNQNDCPPATPKSHVISHGALVDDSCFEYKNCTRRTLYCSYTSSAGHQPPVYFTSEAMAFFRSLQ
jgi:polyhydroxybutyrate depolymerase